MSARTRRKNGECPTSLPAIKHAHIMRDVLCALWTGRALPHAPPAAMVHP